MNSDLNKKMEQAQQGIARLRKVDSILKQLELEKETLRREEGRLKKIMDKENHQLEKLEHKTIASVFYSILGNLDEHVEKERKEALSAKLRYDQIVKDLADVTNQILKLAAERLDYTECQSEYNILLAQKKDELMSENGETAQKILELTDQLNLTRINLKEIKEAISVGSEVLNSLDNVLSSLDSAEGWGMWDLLGGGLISSLAKHSRIDDAKLETENTQRLLRKFKSELTDISISSDIIFETNGFAKFADFFFDGLIADWYMQSKINQSQSSVEEVKSQVLHVIHKLESMKTQELGNVERIKAKITDLIVKG